MEKNINMEFCILIYSDLQSLTLRQNIFTCILYIEHYIIVEELQKCVNIFSGGEYQYGFMHIDLPWFTIIDFKTKYIYMNIDLPWLH